MKDSPCQTAEWHNWDIHVAKCCNHIIETNSQYCKNARACNSQSGNYEPRTLQKLGSNPRSVFRTNSKHAYHKIWCASDQ